MKGKFTMERSSIDGSITLVPNEPRYSLIWLHGLGDTSEGFLDWFKMPNSPLYSGARICLLQAPIRKVTVNGGAQCTSWYDIKTFDREKWMKQSDEDVYSMEEIKDSQKILDRRVKEEAQLWKAKGKSDPFRRVIVGGFSQGCAIALSYGISYEPAVGGIVGYSGHLFKSTPPTNLGKTPIILYHGLEDPLLHEKEIKMSYQRILSAPNVSYTALKGLGHSVDLPEMAGTVEWLAKWAPKD